MAAADETPEVEDAGELYGLAPEHFVAARDALAKRLRSGGERDRAKEIKALRRPSVPAAAVNRAVRAEPDLGAEVVAAGERLGEAQAAAIEDGDASGLRDAMRAESDAVEALVEVIDSDGALGSQMLDRARDTIRAAARSADLREEFLAGRMSRDAEAVGFGGELAQADPPRKRAKPERAKKASEPKRANKGGSKKGAAKKGAAKKGASKAKSAEPAKPSAAERRKADRAVSKAEAAVEKEERKRAEAADALAELDAELETADEGVEAAKRELAAAEKALERARRDRDRGAERVEKAEAKVEERNDELQRARSDLAELGDP